MASWRYWSPLIGWITNESRRGRRRRSSERPRVGPRLKILRQLPRSKNRLSRWERWSVDSSVVVWTSSHLPFPPSLPVATWRGADDSKHGSQCDSTGSYWLSKKEDLYSSTAGQNSKWNSACVNHFLWLAGWYVDLCSAHSGCWWRLPVCWNRSRDVWLVTDSSCKYLSF